MYKCDPHIHTSMDPYQRSPGILASYVITLYRSSGEMSLRTSPLWWIDTFSSGIFCCLGGLVSFSFNLRLDVGTFSPELYIDVPDRQRWMCLIFLYQWEMSYRFTSHHVDLILYIVYSFDLWHGYKYWFIKKKKCFIKCIIYFAKSYSHSLHQHIRHKLF